MDKIQMQILRLGVNNNKEIIVEWNHEMFNEMSDIEPLHTLMGILERLKLKLNTQIDEIEYDNANANDDTEEEDDIF